MNPANVSVTLDSEHTVHESNHTDALSTQNSQLISARNEILARQVQAFLEATEDVDADVETIEDILDVLSYDESDDIEDHESVPELQMEHEDVDSHDEDGDDVPDIAMPFLGLAQDSADEPWGKHEVKQMTHFVKRESVQNFKPENQNHDIFSSSCFEPCARKRDKLPQYNTIEDAVNLIRGSRRILILTGAGISVSCGIPDFRSRDGLYASLKNKGEYDLDDPQQMFDIKYFKENPSVFYSFCQIYPSNFIPSPCHRFIKLIEGQGKLLRNYTQNIDTLETLAGVKNVLQCHGSFATASCLLCHQRVPGTEIESNILNHKVPLCKVCNAPSFSSAPNKPKKMSKKKAKGQWDSDVEDESDSTQYPPGIMKPDITFFGEKLTDEFDQSLAEDRWKADLLLIVGTSLKVSPVAEITSHLPHSIPQILINKTPIRHINPDIVLLGNADNIVIHLCKELGWELPPPKEPNPATATVSTTADGTIINQANGSAIRLQPPRATSNLKKRPSSSADDETGESSSSGGKTPPPPPERVGESHVWLFEGAEGGKWLQELKKELGIPKSTSPSASTSGHNTRHSTPAASPAGKSDGRREAKKARVA